jgi:arsenate reductase-like glutaredoxin family protein
MNVTRSATILCSIVLMLSGCYETEVPLIERGERTSLAGNFQCLNPGNTDAFAISFTETVETIERSGRQVSYRYVDQDGHAYLLKKLPSGLFLGQAKAERSLEPFQINTDGFEYAFVRFVDANTFLVFLDDVVEKWPQVEKLLATQQADYKRDEDLLFLSGSSEKSLRFLVAHDKTLLKEPTRCTRAKI